MKAICAISGQTFTLSTFPLTCNTRDYTYHPAFQLSTKKLLGLMPSYLAGQLSDNDTNLLFLTLIHSTTLIEWHTTAQLTISTATQWLHKLVEVSQIIATMPESNIIRVFPKYAITPENANFHNIGEVLAHWLDIAHDYQRGISRSYNASDEELVERRNLALQRLMRKSEANSEKFALRCANWANTAAKFPEPKKVQWTQLIADCGSQRKLWLLNRSAIEEVIDHVLLNVELGTYYSDALLGILRKALNAQNTFLGIDIDVTYEFVDDNNFDAGDTGDAGDNVGNLEDSDIQLLTGSTTSATKPKQLIAVNKLGVIVQSDPKELANLNKLIANSPTTEPKRSEYASTVDYLRARAAWDMTKRLQA